MKVAFDMGDIKNVRCLSSVSRLNFVCPIQLKIDLSVVSFPGKSTNKIFSMDIGLKCCEKCSLSLCPKKNKDDVQ